MASNHIDQEIRSRIDAFLAEISALLKQSALESVQEALGDGAATGRRGPGRPRGSGMRAVRRPKLARAGQRIRRSADDLAKIAARVQSYVNAHPGKRLEEIGRALGSDTGILKRPIANLMATKSLRTTGAKRGTMYFSGKGRAQKTPSKTKARTRRNVKSNRKAMRRRTPRRTPKASTVAAPATAAA